MRTKTKPIDCGSGNKTADGVYVKEGDIVWIWHPSRRQFEQTKILRFSDRCIGVAQYTPFFWERAVCVKHRIASLRKAATNANAEADRLQFDLDSPPAAE